MTERVGGLAFTTFGGSFLSRRHFVGPSSKRCRVSRRIAPYAARRRIVVELPRPLGLMLEESTDLDDSRRTRSVVVSSVGAGSPASGIVCVGDVVVATSATFGDDTWPTRSLDGAVYAIRSRCGDTVKLVLEREDDAPSSEPVRVAPPPPIPAPPRRRVISASAAPSTFTAPADLAGGASDGGVETAVQRVSGTQEIEHSEVSEALNKFEELLVEFTKFRAKRVADALVPCAIEVVREHAVAPNPRVSEITSLVQRMKRAEAPLSLKFYNNLMWSYVKAKHPRKAIDMFDELPNPNVECYTTVAKAYSLLNRPDDALGLLPVMRARGVTPNVYMYNAVIASCVRAGSLRKALALFSEMPNDNVQPNVVSWNIIINWHAQQKKGAARLAGIAQAFADMKNSGIQPNAVTFTTMMKAYAASGAVNKAEGIFAEMKKRFPVIQVDTEAYNTMLTAHSSRLDWRRCLELLDEMQDSSRYRRNAGMPYREDDSGFGRGGTSASISSSRNVLSNGSVRVGDYSRKNGSRTDGWLHSVYRDDNLNGHPLLTPNAVTYSLVIRGCADAGRVNIAHAVFDEMIQAGFSPPPAHAVMSLLNGYARIGDFTHGLVMVKQLKTWGMSPNLRMMSALMHASIQAGQASLALSIYSRIEAANINPDVVTYTILIKAYGLKGEIEKAFDVVTGMLQSGSSTLPNVVTYNTLIEVAVRNGCYDMGLKALSMLLHNEHGVTIDSNTYRALVRNAVSLNDNARNTADDERDNVAPNTLSVEAKYVAETDTKKDSSSRTVSLGDKEYLQYLMDAVRLVRDAGMTANGVLYVALLETCEQLQEWQIGMTLLDERRNHLFRVERASASEARLFEETFKKQTVKQHAP